MADQYFKLSGTQIMLACVLDRILREHLKFTPIKHPGWTFQHVADYRVPDGPVYEHDRSVYLGGARAEGPTRVGLESFMEVRIHATRNNWTALPSCGSEIWTFTVWAKTPGRNIGPHVFLYTERDNQINLCDLAPEPAPRKIDLWWKQALTVAPRDLQQDPDGRRDEARPNYD